ncbi:MAG: outer membrane protein assembly factor BamD [Bacteroidota bacterium]|nr:outer membrane protein assembly factor BamD [Bacteroidota bacterium]
MIRKLAFILFVAFILGGCSDYQKLLKSSDQELKYTKAIGYYNEGDYYRALQLFDQVIPIYRGTDKAEDLFYYYAYCYYNQEDYVMGSYYFKRFAKNFPNSDRAEECWYMSAYCKYEESPIYSLDPSNTKDGIKQLQSFINRFPESDKVEKCNGLIDELHAKLEKKIYEQGNLYFKTEDYEASNVTFENLMKEYPATKFREDVLFKILKSYYLYAENSIYSKQDDRYQMAVESYDKLITFYPETEKLKEAEEMHKKALHFLNNYKY